MSEWRVEVVDKHRKKNKRTNQKHERRKKRKFDDKKKSKAFDIDFRYKTSLPPPIGHPKLLQVPLPPDYLTRYMSAELETQRQWNLHSEGGLVVPIDLWDPTTYKPLKEEQPKTDEDAELLALLLKNSSSNMEDHKLNRSQYYSMNKVSWTLNPEMMTRGTRVRKVRGAGMAREYDTKFASKDVVEKIVAKQKSLLSVEAIEKSFKNIDNLQHPSKPHLTVAESLPIFPDDRLLENQYHHISFDRAPVKEVVKLPFLQSQPDLACEQACAKSLIRVSKNRGRGGHFKEWYSMYTPDDSKSTDIETELEWTSEFAKKFEGEADFSHFFVKVDNEVVWGNVKKRTKLRRIATENVESKTDRTFSRHDRDVFAGLPRYLGVEAVNEEEDEVSEEELEGAPE